MDSTRSETRDGRGDDDSAARAAFEEEVRAAVADVRPHVRSVRVARATSSSAELDVHVLDEGEHVERGGGGGGDGEPGAGPQRQPRRLRVTLVRGVGVTCDAVARGLVFDSVQAVLSRASPAYRGSFAAAVDDALRRRMQERPRGAS